MKKILFKVTGGLGRNIAGTAVVRQIKEQYPDCTLRVMASYPDVFIGNPHIDRVYPYTQQGPDFYEANKEFDIWEVEPYQSIEYRQGKSHLVDVWCDKLGLNRPSKLSGEIFLTDEEKLWAENQKKRINHNGPIVAIQISGGVSSYNPNDALDILRPKQIRSLPVKIAQEVVDELQKQGILALQIGLPTEQRLEKCMFLDSGNQQPLSNRLVFSTINSCDNFFGIDSFGNHLWQSLGKTNSAVICWGATSPKALGYSANSNLSLSGKCPTPHCNRPEGHLSDVDGSGRPWQCKHKGACMEYDPKEIVSAILATIEVKKEKPNA